MGDLAPAERIALLVDEWALVRRGDRPIGSFLDLCAACGGEADYAVLEELGARLAAVEAKLDGVSRAGFQAFVRGLLGPQLRALGWEARPGEPDEVRLRRAALVRAVGVTAHDPSAAAEARSRLTRFLAGEAAALEPNLHEAAVAITARDGDEARFEELLERFRREADPAYKRRYLVALAAFEASAPAQRARDLALTETVPLQDAASFVAGLLANRIARDDTWAMLRERWSAVAARLGGAPMLLRRVVEAVGQLPHRHHLEEAQAFFESHPVPAARQAIAQTLERMRQDVTLWERCGMDVSRWLAGR
jgi:puromycin-sensitive aminopeptidase